MRQLHINMTMVLSSVLMMINAHTNLYANPIDIELQTSVCQNSDDVVIGNEAQALRVWSNLHASLNRAFGHAKYVRPEKGYQLVYDFSDPSYHLDEYGVSLKLKVSDVDGYNYRVKSSVKISNVDQALYQRLEGYKKLELINAMVSEFNQDQAGLDRLLDQGYARLIHPVDSAIRGLSQLMQYEVSFESQRSAAPESNFGKNNINKLFQYGKGSALQNCENEQNCPLSQSQRQMLNALAYLRNIPLKALPSKDANIAQKLNGHIDLIQVGQLAYQKQVWSLGPYEQDWVNSLDSNQNIKNNFMNESHFEVHLERWINVHDFASSQSVFEISLKAKNIKQDQDIQKLGENFFASLDDVGVQRCQSRLRTRDFAKGNINSEPLAQK